MGGFRDRGFLWWYAATGSATFLLSVVICLFSLSHWSLLLSDDDLKFCADMNMIQGRAAMAQVEAYKTFVNPHAVQVHCDEIIAIAERLKIERTGIDIPDDIEGSVEK